VACAQQQNPQLQGATELTEASRAALNEFLSLKKKQYANG